MPLPTDFITNDGLHYYSLTLGLYQLNELKYLNNIFTVLRITSFNLLSFIILKLFREKNWKNMNN